MHHDRAAVGTEIGILAGEKVIRQLLHFHQVQGLIDLDRGFAGHAGK